MTKPEHSNPSLESRLESRIAACPIHHSINIEALLEMAGVPQKFRPVFHEIVTIRGEYPKALSDAEIIKFGNRAASVIRREHIDSLSELKLSHLLGLVVTTWLASSNPTLH